jgi:hypothetical protein
MRRAARVFGASRLSDSLRIICVVQATDAPSFGVTLALGALRRPSAASRDRHAGRAHRNCAQMVRGSASAVQSMPPDCQSGQRRCAGNCIYKHLHTRTSSISATGDASAKGIPPAHADRACPPCLPTVPADRACRPCRASGALGLAERAAVRSASARGNSTGGTQEGAERSDGRRQRVPYRVCSACHRITT